MRRASAVAELGVVSRFSRLLLMLNPDSMGHSWLSATPSAKREYVVAACRGCSERALGDAIPDKVVAGIDEFFARSANLKWKVSYAFGLIFRAVSTGVDYRLLLDP